MQVSRRRYTRTVGRAFTTTFLLASRRFPLAIAIRPYYVTPMETSRTAITRSLIPPTTVDNRTDEERASTVAYACARDRALSGGWAGVRNSTYVIACSSWAEADVVASNMDARSDMTHVRIASRPPRTRGAGHHVEIVGRSTASAWFRANAWR